MSTHMFLVTVKLPKRTDHDPHNKVTDQCPAEQNNPHFLCTDVTGEHHTVVLETDSRVTASELREYFKNTNNHHAFNHITRIEGPVTRQQFKLT